MSRNHTWLLLPVLILAAGSVFAKQIDVTECGTVIDEPGKYRVTNDLLACPASEAGVLILASDVTLDLRGHTISCELVVPLHAGVEVFGAQNVRIRNGTITGCGGGVALVFTDVAKVTKMSMNGNGEAVVLVAATDSLIKNNQFADNIDRGIMSWWGSSNLYSHNTMNFEFEGILLIEETDSIIKCNTVENTFYAISAGPYSTGNILRGNLVTGGYSGIMLWGEGTLPEAPERPVASGNLVKNNMLGNVLDLSEIVYDENAPFPSIYVDPGDVCQNAWMNNQFGSELGPSDCIGVSVELDEDDVCALDDD